MTAEMEYDQLVGAGLVEAWNSQHPSGTPVIVIQNDGKQVISKTRSIAWTLGHGEAVVKYEGRTGGYALSRVVPMVSKVDYFARIRTMADKAGIPCTDLPGE